MMTAAGREIRASGARAEAGFTVIEVVVAALLLAISALAILGLVDSASRSNYRAQQSQVVSDRLQQEMESIKQLPYAQVALTAAPAPSNDPTSPNSRVSGAQFNVDRTGAVSDWNLVYNGGHSNETGGALPTCSADPSKCGKLDPGPTPFQSGNVKGQIYRYVVWEPQAGCTNCAHEASSDSYNGQQVEWFKHVVVAITLDQTASGGIRSYQEIQGDVGNPDQGLGTGSGGGTSNNTAQPWTFWLTDTPCSLSSRQSVTADHPTHNTLGGCNDGPQTGGTAGAPGLMLTQAGPFDNGVPDSQAPLYDYATDVEPAQNPDQDKGVQATVPANTIGGGSCLTDISSSSSLQTLGPTPQFYLHKWLSPQIPSGSGTVTLDGRAELDLWTQTINGALQPGKICIWVFSRSVSGGTVSDTLAVNPATGTPYFTYSRTSWDRSQWVENDIPLNLRAPGGGSVQIPQGSRLGVAIAVERQGTCPASGSCSGAGLQFMYDHPTYDTRLVVDTHSQLPF
jgi:Tfp pilus assembly protein PilV